MRLVTVRIDGRTRAGRVENGDVVLLDSVDVRAVLETSEGLDDARTATGRTIKLTEADLAPVIPRPDKTVCVGKNYLAHSDEMAHSPEMGSERPAHPIYFTKYARSLIGGNDDIELPDPAVSAQVDWEGELAIVIGRSVRNASAAQAHAAIAGFTVCNDISMRDWQFRSGQFLAGKAWENSTPLGPALVTRDDVGDGLGLGIRTEVDGVVKQVGNTADMLFSPIDIVQDLSRIITLDPGDVVATGTPDGVGHARRPPEYLTDGSVVTVTIDGVGEIVNRCVVKPA
jgi:acylpyruvate hydrolase